jgi:DNA recombination protein RmuC
MTLPLVLLLLSATACGFLAGWLIVASRKASLLRSIARDLDRATAERDLAREERARADALLSELRLRIESEQQARVAAETRREEVEKKAAGQEQFVTDSRQQLEATYAQLSQTALEGAIAQLNHLVRPHLERNKGEIVTTLEAKKGEIETLVAPLREMLVKYETELKESEALRNRGYASIEQQVKALLEATEATRRETSKVATALASPKVSGTWGEQALERCVELAGMSAYCDFTTQETFSTADRNRIRPDMIIKLPHGHVIAVDSKAPTSAYLEAAAATDESRQKELLATHAKNIRRHIDQLSAKEYHQNIEGSLDLTVLFLGGEQFLYSALVADPALFEYGAEKKIFIATPTVLVPLLRVVSAAWRAEQTEENALRVVEIGNELYERFLKVFRDIEGVGRALETASGRYNEAVRSIDTRLVPKVRELQARAGNTKELPEFERVEAALLTSARIGVAEE